MLQKGSSCLAICWTPSLTQNGLLGLPPKIPNQHQEEGDGHRNLKTENKEEPRVGNKGMRGNSTTPYRRVHRKRFQIEAIRKAEELSSDKDHGD
ncbi:hypothetical protein UY3_10514 [Chelonia mydas]|uniref:Uncharacterized protein n=1 Tax=Chelonia mydas TaxID=8469 RepID=M7BW22_CHEMY|nr:hypothetical protein UY3_10514 [Chelonia mydas]